MQAVLPVGLPRVRQWPGHVTRLPARVTGRVCQCRSAFGRWLRGVSQSQHNRVSGGLDATLTTVVFCLFSVFAVFSTPYHLFSTRCQLFSTSPSNFLYLSYSTPIGARSLLRRYIHPFGLYESSLQPAHTSPPATLPPPCPIRPAIPPPSGRHPTPTGPPQHPTRPHLAAVVP